MNIKKPFLDFKAIKIKKRYENWQKEKQLIKMEQEMASEKKKLKGKKISFSKIALIILFINFTFLEALTGLITIMSLHLATISEFPPDFTPITTLLGAVIGQTLSYGIYSLKAKAENTKDGLVYDLTMKNQTNEEEMEENENE